MTSFDPNTIMQSVGYVIFVLFILYGQKLQLMTMLGQIKQKMTKLKIMRDQSYQNLRKHIYKHIPPTSMTEDMEKRLQILIDSVAIPPVSHLDPAGIVAKVESVTKTYEKYMKNGLRRIVGNVSQSELENLTNTLEVNIEISVLYKIVDHFYRLAKKGELYGAMMLNMALPQLMKIGEALQAGSSHFQSGLPVGDTFGPMVASKLSEGGIESCTDSETSVKDLRFEGRRLVIVKARGPGGSVGNPAMAIQEIVQVNKPSLIVTVDAALQLESEPTGTISEGVGTAMGGNGTERFRIEEATVSIPVLTVVCKMSLKEAISAMPKVVYDQVGPVVERVKSLIRENSENGQTVLVVGVGNTMGVE